VIETDGGVKERGEREGERERNRGVEGESEVQRESFTRSVSPQKHTYTKYE
jgi:hypothetical protein